MADIQENMVEWISGEHYMTTTFTDRKRSNRLRKLYKERPEDFKYIIDNDDGYVTARIPLRWLKINPGSKTKRKMSEEQKKKSSENLAKARAAKNSNK